MRSEAGTGTPLKSKHPANDLREKSVILNKLRPPPVNLRWENSLILCGPNGKLWWAWLDPYRPAICLGCRPRSWLGDALPWKNTGATAGSKSSSGLQITRVSSVDPVCSGLVFVLSRPGYHSGEHHVSVVLWMFFGKKSGARWARCLKINHSWELLQSVWVWWAWSHQQQRERPINPSDTSLNVSPGFTAYRMDGLGLACWTSGVSVTFHWNMFS